MLPSFASLVIALLLAGCPQAPTTPPVAEDGGRYGDAPIDGGTPCERACNRLRDLACPEGDSIDGGESCEATCQHVVATRLTRLDPECLAAATSQDGARVCGAAIRCGR